MPTDAAVGGSAKGRRLLGEDQLFLLLSILIGVFAGLAVVCFRMAIDATRWIFFGSGLMPPRGRVILVPGAVGLLVAFLVVRFFPRVRGSGVNQTKSALYIYDGYIPGSTIIGKFIHAAIYGVWPDEPTAHRWQIRFELSEYLLRQNTPQDPKAAQAELVALAAELPPQDVAAQMRLGTLFLQAGLYARALTAFRAALADQPNLMPALEAASEAAFRMGDYPTARHYLLPIVAQKPKDEHSLELLNLSELVIKLDPSERGLPSQEQARRALQDFHLALARAQKCTPSAGSGVAALVDQAKSIKPNERILARNPDAIAKTMDLVFKLEKASAPCGPAGLEDKALGLLAQQSEMPR